MMYQPIVVLHDAPDFYCASLRRNVSAAREHAHEVAKDMGADPYDVGCQQVFLTTK